MSHTIVEVPFWMVYAHVREYSEAGLHMHFQSILVAVLCFAMQSAVADTLDQLAGKSAIIRNNLEYLKSYKAISAFAGTKKYCPSVFVLTGRPSEDKTIRRKFRDIMNKEMKGAGFPKQSITHCIENSGYVFKAGELIAHPRNTSDPNYVEAGILVYRMKGEAKITSIPICSGLQS